MDLSVLAKSYNALQYQSRLKDLLNSYYKTSNFDGWEKFTLHQAINDAVFKDYNGEQVLKYKLAQLFKCKEYVGAFEVKAKSSRADFLVINGDTKCFEVKSKIDTLARLNKQSQDYKDIFEYNTVVVDKKHLMPVRAIVPEYYGIWYFQGHKKIEYRNALLSPFIDAEAQLAMLTKKELKTFFGDADAKTILKSLSGTEINQSLKDALKYRYQTRWNFIKNNWDNILPIDLQFFFNTNVCPKLIYST
ncbi:MAG TPA: sce7726 family protein [Flavobacterium sp.]|nr:sce7726 family protein [Flavobacterium sp.]